MISTFIAFLFVSLVAYLYLDALEQYKMAKYIKIIAFLTILNIVLVEGIAISKGIGERLDSVSKRVYGVQQTIDNFNNKVEKVEQTKDRIGNAVKPLNDIDKKIKNKVNGLLGREEEE